LRNGVLCPTFSPSLLRIREEYLAVSSTTAKGIEVRDLTGKSAVGSGMIAFVTRGLVLRLVPVVASIRFGAA